MTSMRSLGLHCASSGNPPHGLHVFKALYMAQEAGYLLREITGDRVRIVRTGRQYWELQRYTGTQWVKG